MHVITAVRHNVRQVIMRQPAQAAVPPVVRVPIRVRERPVVRDVRQKPIQAPVQAVVRHVRINHPYHKAAVARELKPEQQLVMLPMVHGQPAIGVLVRVRATTIPVTTRRKVADVAEVKPVITTA